MLFDETEEKKHKNSARTEEALSKIYERLVQGVGVGGGGGSVFAGCGCSSSADHQHCLRERKVNEGVYCTLTDRFAGSTDHHFRFAKGEGGCAARAPWQMDAAVFKVTLGNILLDGSPSTVPPPTPYL